MKALKNRFEVIEQIVGIFVEFETFSNAGYTNIILTVDKDNRGSVNTVDTMMEIKPKGLLYVHKHTKTDFTDKPEVYAIFKDRLVDYEIYAENIRAELGAEMDYVPCFLDFYEYASMSARDMGLAIHFLDAWKSAYIESGLCKEYYHKAESILSAYELDLESSKYKYVIKSKDYHSNLQIFVDKKDEDSYVATYTLKDYGYLIDEDVTEMYATESEAYNQIVQELCEGVIAEINDTLEANEFRLLNAEEMREIEHCLSPVTCFVADALSIAFSV